MGLVIPTSIGALALLLLYHHVLYPAFISPLRKLPAAHWTCHFSSIWILAARLYRRENRSLHKAHIKLGPVVRIGPAEVSVDGVEGMRVIYQGGFEKGFWYSVFSNYGSVLSSELPFLTDNLTWLLASPICFPLARPSTTQPGNAWWQTSIPSRIFNRLKRARLR